MQFPSIPLSIVDWVVFFGAIAVLAAPLFLSGETRRNYNIWAPRILIGFALVLLVYFTQRTYRFKGTLDDTFLAPENLNLVRGPLAKDEYYRRGMPDYQGKPLFEAEPTAAPAAIPDSTAAETVPPETP